MRYRCGVSVEREFVKFFESKGFVVFCLVGSYKIDLVVGNGKEYFCIEVKSMRSRKFYFFIEDVEKFVEFVGCFGGRFVFVVKFVNVGWCFYGFNRLEYGEKSYKIDFEMFFMIFDGFLGK